VSRSRLATANAKTRRKFVTPRVDLDGPSL
jgi:hypothetical protein